MSIKNWRIAALCAFWLAGSAQAVHLDPNGSGQALIYPYYTVNNGQQTLLAVTNGSAAAQAINVRFREGQNGRTVMNLRVFLAPYDMWTATVFDARDAGLDSDGAAILTRDRSCTEPVFVSTLGDGTPYLSFDDDDYTGLAADGGRNDIRRTREGWVEIISLANLLPPLSSAIAHPLDGSPPAGCHTVSALVAGPETTAPTGALQGTASIVNVAQGTILTTRAEALADFTGRQLLGSVPTAFFAGLASVNDGEGLVATARIVDGEGRMQTLTYGGDHGRPIDAVSAVLMADRIHNEYQTNIDIGGSSDWVLTMPTKAHYTDPALLGAMPAVLPPFDELFSAEEPGASRVMNIERSLFNRESRPRDGCPAAAGSTGCVELPSIFNTATTVVNFLDLPDNLTGVVSSVLGSTLTTNVRPVIGPAGWLQLDMDRAGSGHRLPPSAEGKVLRGLPVIGFWAFNLVNNQVMNGVLSNYSAAVRHATSGSCVKASDGSPCD